jgi:hypothetical protein
MKLKEVIGEHYPCPDDSSFILRKPSGIDNHQSKGQGKPFPLPTPSSPSSNGLKDFCLKQ